MPASQGYRVETPKVRWPAVPQVWLDAVEAVWPVWQGRGRQREVKALCISSLYGGSGIAADAQIKPLHPCLIG